MTRRKKLENKLDKMCSEKVKELAGWRCEKCGRENCKLDWHHIFKRSKRSTRWDLGNGLCLCFVCHRLGAHSPDWGIIREFDKWLEWHMGSDKIVTLEQKSNQLKKHSLDELESLILEIENG